ncbi:hypothetical protein [Kribbella sp. VKM Ac-2568]|uniref:hypothetical protein n=1 Tax=Kribbella sp. VKM Ac-2568 TaxID=2512219 RepID=UPI00104FD213|nr:hypothetical protein [Kribbella sp. VKM Ac-2568]TCM35136.1 hypothetical protein EV648_12529 [Kribbella sp. VKM Ac-2568]
MSAMFAFERGEVFMKSPTFELVMNDLDSRLTHPADKYVVEVAVAMNCLWVDQIPADRKSGLLAALCGVLVGQLNSGAHDDNPVAIADLQEIIEELSKRYPGDVAG